MVAQEIYSSFDATHFSYNRGGGGGADDLKSEPAAICRAVDMTVCCAAG